MSGFEDIPKSLPKGQIHIFPTEQPWPKESSDIRISILDSSFNPPTRAHLALASLPPPASPSPQSSPSLSTNSNKGDNGYTSHLLLFSYTNVEKTLKPSDPSVEQRLHLISLLLPYLPSNTAIGLINEPTFVGKSKIIHDYISTMPASEPSTEEPSEQKQRRQPRAKLTFIIGTDTLTRFFDPRFYTSQPGGMDSALSHFFEEEQSTIISARRGGAKEREIEESVISRKEVKRLVEEGKVVLMGTGEEAWVGMSSTKVREAVKKGDWEEVGRLVVPEIAEYIKDEGLYRD